MPIVFDLDDTLYPELSYVYSGFAVVAAYLSARLNISQAAIEEELKGELNRMREKVFDRFLLKHNLYSAGLVKKCLALYRGHTPSLTLFPEAAACLETLKDCALYVVTDGNKLVQKKKFLSLNISHYIKKCFCTHAYGIQKGKPSPYCFEKICLLEKTSPNNVVYIADNPCKDFVGIKPHGFGTIRVLTGPYKDIALGETFEADWKIKDLSELPALIKKIGLA